MFASISTENFTFCIFFSGKFPDQARFNKVAKITKDSQSLYWIHTDDHLYSKNPNFQPRRPPIHMSKSQQCDSFHTLIQRGIACLLQSIVFDHLFIEKGLYWDRGREI